MFNNYDNASFEEGPARTSVTGFDSRKEIASSGQAPQSFVEQAILRLAAAIEEETTALNTNKGVDAREYQERKNQGLLELHRAMKFANEAPLEARLSQQLEVLRTKLEENQSALKRHMQAVEEISTIVSDAIRDSESDGTYTIGIRSVGQAR